MRFLKSLSGKQRLAVVFWLYCILGSAVAIALPILLAEWLHNQGVPLWGFKLIAVAEVAFVVWAHLSLWMCAFNSGHRWLGYVVRLYSFVALVVFFLPVAFYHQPSTIEVNIVSDR